MNAARFFGPNPNVTGICDETSHRADCTHSEIFSKWINIAVAEQLASNNMFLSGSIQPRIGVSVQRC
jgi:hypothetical protein